MLLFFAFFMLASMAGCGIQAWLITVLHQVHGMGLVSASATLTAYMVGATAACWSAAGSRTASTRTSFAASLTVPRRR